MKENPTDNIRQDMAEGRTSLTGYLGNDKRSIKQIIKDDAVILDKFGVTKETLATTMRRLTRAGMAALGDPVIESGYELSVDEWRGWLGCPFKDNRRAAKRITYLRRLSDNKTFQWTDLNIHLIEEHGFFQGVGAAHRIEPAELIEYLHDLLSEGTRKIFISC